MEHLRQFMTNLFGISSECEIIKATTFSFLGAYICTFGKVEKKI